MVDRKIGCLPVIEGEALIGILSESDVVSAVAQGSL
jgi:CBS domain-containing protein